MSEVVLPRRGTAALFSSGWENVHQVARVTAGQRHSLPAFFTTEQPPTPAPWGVDKRGGAPECRAARAAALWELGLMPRSERRATLWPSCGTGRSSSIPERGQVSLCLYPGSNKL